MEISDHFFRRESGRIVATLTRIFGIDKPPLLFLHLYLVIPIFAFPLAHALVHWRNGKVLSIFRPRAFERRPSFVEILQRLKQENLRLKERRTDEPYESRR